MTRVSPFPPSARVAHPLGDLRVDVGPVVERDDPRLAHHLVEDYDVAGSLEDVVAGVVGVRDHRSRHAAGDAAAVRAHVFVRVGPVGDEPSGARLGFRLRRHAPGRRIRDHRRAARVDDGVARIAPEVVVAAIQAPGHGGPRAARRAVTLEHLAAEALDLGRLLLGVELLVAEPRRPFERRQRVVRPDTRNVRLSIKRARRAVVGIGRNAPLTRRALRHRHCQHRHRHRDRNPLVHRLSA